MKRVVRCGGSVSLLSPVSSGQHSFSSEERWASGRQQKNQDQHLDSKSPKGLKKGSLYWVPPREEFPVRQVVELKEHRARARQHPLCLPPQGLDPVDVKEFEKLKALNKCKDFAVDPSAHY